MTIAKILIKTTIAAAFASVAVAGGVSAQEWRGGEVHRFEHEAHRFGEFCSYRVETRGLAEKKFFGFGPGAGGARKAEERAIHHWEETVSSTVGPQFANWALAQGKSVGCHPEGLVDVACVVVANPCREHREFREERHDRR